MCGIVGYVGPRSAVPIILDELRRLEYRGYDSAGVAVLDAGRCRVVKTVGKVADLAALLDAEPLNVHLGIGHTRWATHGQPSTVNAHPHLGAGGTLAVVHNGIIENYAELRERLRAGGAVFVSETDTEVIAHLLAAKLAAGAPDIKAALLAAAKELRGAFAVAVTAESEPDKLLVVRHESPLVLGLGQGENFLASDIPALLPYTRDVILLEDGDVAEITRDGITLSNLAGEPVTRDLHRVEWELGAAEKGGYEHYMLKEIDEIPTAVRQTLRGRTSKAGALDGAEIALAPEVLQGIRRLYFVACGTSYHAGLVGKYVCERLLRLPVEVDHASEFRYRDPLLGPDTLVVVISQSGETADTLAALREARRRGAPTLGIVNVVGSSIYREADAVFPTWAGPEICVASTKAYVTQLVALYLLALHLGRVRGAVADDEVARIVQGLHGVPAAIEAVLARRDELQELGERYARLDHFFFIGRGLDAALSHECALKLKEISYKHAEAYPAGELKHGPLALMDDEVLVFALGTQHALIEKTLSNIKEVKARRAAVVAVVAETEQSLAAHVDGVLRIPALDDLLAPFVAIVPVYLFTYWLSAHLGREIDQPRNLAKSVTVE